MRGGSILEVLRPQILLSLILSLAAASGDEGHFRHAGYFLDLCCRGVPLRSTVLHKPSHRLATVSVFQETL